MEKLTKLEIIEETVKFYSEDTSRRSIKRTGDSTGNKCFYTHPETGNNCALGRCFTKEGLERILEERINDMGSIDLDISIGVEECLQDKYKGHSLSFWSELQQLHDLDIYWDSELSDAGKEYVTILKEKYKNN